MQSVNLEGMPGDPATDTYLFETVNGKTVLSIISDYGSLEVRDMVLASGMEWGANESFDRLEELLTQVKA